MKIQIKQATNFSNPGVQAVHVLEITPCNVPMRKDIAPEVILAWLFRQLNRVNGDELISVFQLHMPSLSVGDVVELEGHGVWRCESVGWLQIS